MWFTYNIVNVRMWTAACGTATPLLLQEVSVQEHPEGFVLTGDKPVAAAPAADEAVAGTSDGRVLGKRKAEGAAGDAPAAKRPARSDEAGVMLLDSSDDDGPGAAAGSDSDVVAIE